MAGGRWCRAIWCASTTAGVTSHRNLDFAPGDGGPTMRWSRCWRFGACRPWRRPQSSSSQPGVGRRANRGGGPCVPLGTLILGQP
jgi:hypothetical protein